MAAIARCLSVLRCAALLALITACTSAPNEEKKPVPAHVARNPHQFDAYFNQLWPMNQLWEDGLAEVALYAAERVIYDEPRSYEYVQITVKEEFNQQYNVKTDDYQRQDLFPVMKVNQFCRIETGQYPYHFLTSLFFRRDQPLNLHKMTTSSQEWCGNTFKAFTNDDLQYVETYNSYWDGQGAGQRKLRHDILFEDALPYSLRSLKFADKPRFTAIIAELQQTSKAAPPVYYDAQISVAAAPAADTPEPAWRVTVALDRSKQNQYWFARAYPNILLRQTTWDGRNMTLTAVRRYAYWKH